LDHSKRDAAHRSSPNRKSAEAIVAKVMLGSHAANQAARTPERPSDDVIPEAGQDSFPWPTTPIAASQPMKEIG
jgi:hypothetical protein